MYIPRTIELPRNNKIWTRPYEGLAGEVVDRAVLKMVYQQYHGKDAMQASSLRERVLFTQLRTETMGQQIAFPAHTPEMKKYGRGLITCKPASRTADWYWFEGPQKDQRRSIPIIYQCERRICPQCYARKLEKWYKRMADKKLPSPDGYQVVYTELNNFDVNEFKAEQVKIRRRLKKRCNRDYIRAGDLFDDPFPPSEAVTFVRAQIERLHAAGLTFFFIDGNHDAAVPPWASMALGAIHVDRQLFSPCRGLIAYGLDYRPATLPQRAMRPHSPQEHQQLRVPKSELMPSDGM